MGNNPEITVERIKSVINLLRKKGEKITYDNVAIEARCTNNFYLSHPHLRDIVDFEKTKVISNTELVVKRSKRKASKDINIKPQEVINAINYLKEENKKVTYKAISIIIKDDYWNLKERPEIVDIIKPHLTAKAPIKKYFFTK